MAQSFNQTMRSIYDSLMTETESQIPQIFQQQDQSENDSSDRDMAMAEFHQARVMQDTAKVLFDLLTEKHEPCQVAHSALIHLNGFDQPKIDMIMSLCSNNGGNGASKKWHQVYWTSKIPLNASLAPRSSIESIFSAVRSARQFKKLLHVYLKKDGSWDCAAASPADRMKGTVRPPDLTLDKLLSASQDDSEMKLPKKEKLKLAMAIARSLLYLSGSPLLQGQWSAENIHVTQTAAEGVGSGLRTKPYIVRELRNEPLNDTSGVSSNTNRYFLDLGALLWHLLFGKKVDINEDDREEDEDEDDPSLSLFNALNREHCAFQEMFFDKPCLDIIANCLNLYSSYQLDDQTFREKIYWNIVMPLKSCLETMDSSKKPPVPPVTDRPRKTLPPMRTSSVHSEIDHRPLLGINNQFQGSLRKITTIKSAYDAAIRSRKYMSPVPTLAEPNLLASSSGVW